MNAQFSYTNKLLPGSDFPALTVNLLSGETATLGQPQQGADWQLVVVYRGAHCPMCTRYLNQLEQFKADLLTIGIDVLAVSADSKAQLLEHKTQLNVSFPLAYGLSEQQMMTLGLYVSDPRSAQETDHRFPEPAMFVVNRAGQIQVIDISNNPFVRPELQTLVNGLGWIRNPANNYPVRGMHKLG